MKTTTIKPHNRALLPVRLLITGIAMLLSFPLAFGQAIQPSAKSDEDKKNDNKKENVIKLEKIEVTGSRIKRLDVETVSPVVQLKVDDIKATGYTNIADAIRALPFNSGQALTPSNAGTSFTPGVNSFNLRGLGNNNTLVLVNGRRAVPYGAPGYDGFQTVFDINSIPEAAIESVEVLKDGGSALYGSDAVAGVVNFKLFKNYEGLSVSYEVGDFFNTSGLQQRIQFVSGATSGKARMLVAASFEEQASVYARDLKYSRDADQTARAHKANPSFDYTGDAISEAYVYDPDSFGFASNPIDDGAFDNRSLYGFPGFVQLDSKTSSRRTFAEPTDNPTVAGATPGYNPYNYQESSGLFGSDRRYSFYSTLNYDFTDYIYGFAEVSFSRVESRNDAAATPVGLASEQGLTIGSRMTIPSYNPYNPWDQDMTTGGRRLVETGSRINNVTSDTPRLLAGLGGKIDDLAFIKNISWEVAALLTKNTVTNTNPGSVTDYRMQQALNGLVRAGDGSLVWQPQATPGYDPNRVYFNWFGYNEQAFVDFLLVDNPNTATLQYTNYDFRLNGEVADLPGGPLGLSIGGEHRAETFASIKSDVNATSNIVGGSSGTSSRGRRSLDALFIEANIPVQTWLEFGLAGRFESYSDDGFKKTLRPKAGFKFRPLDWLIIRGSYAQSYKAPDLAYLYTAATTTFSGGQVRDPVTGEMIQVQTRVAGNPELKPETTDTYYGGISIEPNKGLLKGISISLDYFEYHQKELLGQLSDLYTTVDILSRANAGEEPFASKVFRDPVTNALLYIADDYDNLGTQNYKGWDIDASYEWRTENLGRFKVRGMGTYISSYTSDGADFAGTRLFPRFRGTLEFKWALKDWSVNVYAKYISQRRVRTLYLDAATFDRYWKSWGGDPNVTFGNLYMRYQIKKQITVNPSVTYSGFRNTKITLGVTNVFNQEPPVDPSQATGYMVGVNDGAPAFWYLRAERQF